MKPLRLAALALIGVALGLLGFAATELSDRASSTTPVLPYSALASMGVIAAFTLALGIRVLRWRNEEKRTRMIDPIFAARTLVLAHACAYAGAVLLGWHAGVVANQIPVWAVRATSPVVLQAIAMMGGGVIMVAIGLLVERFCRIPPEDTDEAEGGSGPTRAGDAEGGFA
jgi:NADH:ubiquinone oxidoreductase subunit 5 (subunit L)/multisubunit Na+/H+ antiporter MnhA subunit